MKQLLSLCCWLGLAATVHATSYTITTGTNGSGTVSCNPTNASYPSGVTVGVTATPAAGWYFSGWSGSITNAVNPTNVTIYANLVIDANFLPYTTNTLTLVTNGSGVIDLSPAGGSYASNTTVTATATPSAGWVFAGWSGAGSATTNVISLSLNANATLTGTFAQLPAFTGQPQSITNAAGSTDTFTSAATGTSPVNYQWYFSGGSLAGATNSSLSLTNVQSSQAGAYWAVITNLYGSATSSIVALDLTNAVGSTNVVSSLTDAALRSAMTAGGWVSFSVNGTITLTNSITITGNVILDATGVNVVISGGGSNRIFYVQSGVSLAATNLVLANGYAGATAANPAQGGAIFNNGGSVSLTACLLTNNTAGGAPLDLGGALCNNGGALTLSGCSLSNNAAAGTTAEGGAIFTANGTAVILNSLISSNLTVGSCAGGGLFQASGSVWMTNSALANNKAKGNNGSGLNSPTSAQGGALAAVAGTVTVSLCQFTGNNTQGGGSPNNSPGGAGQGGAIWNAATLSLLDCTVAGNNAASGQGAHGYTALGGGICNTGQMTLIQSVICSNNLTGGQGSLDSTSPINGNDALGGGIYNAGTIAATNATIALNTAKGGPSDNGSPGNYSITGRALGAGLYNDTNGIFAAMNLTIASNGCLAQTSVGGNFSGGFIGGLMAGDQIANTNGTVQLHNCLVVTGGTNGNCYGSLTDIGFNMNSDGTATFSSGSSYNNTNPQLDPLANYGGPSLSMDLLGSSPAIGNGDTNGAPAVDQRGYYRISAEGVDIGAVQYAGTTNPPPAIITQPACLTAASGGSASFNVGATGATPFTYQWQQNGTNLPGATNATLILTNISLSQSGYYYSVTVSNASGSVQSDNAWLTVTGPALAFHFTGTNYSLGFAAVSAKTYDLLVSSNLITWSTQQVIGPFGTSSNFTLPLTSQTNGSRFYRLWQP